MLRRGVYRGFTWPSRHAVTPTILTPSLRTIPHIVILLTKAAQIRWAHPPSDLRGTERVDVELSAAAASSQRAAGCVCAISSSTQLATFRHSHRGAPHSFAPHPVACTLPLYVDLRRVRRFRARSSRGASQAWPATRGPMRQQGNTSRDVSPAPTCMYCRSITVTLES
jgi:hypothetical protein